MTRLALLASMFVVALVVAGCEDKPAPAADPTTSPTANTISPSEAAPRTAPTASATATESRSTAPPSDIPALPVATPPDRFIVKRADGLWLTSLAHPEQNERLASSEFAYAGAVTAGSNAGIYYIASLAAGVGNVEFGLFRKRSGQASTRVASDFSAVCCDVAISPDGEHLAYISHDGLRIRTLSSGTDRLVDAHGMGVCRRPDDSGCARLVQPKWTTDGRGLTFGETGYEQDPVRYLIASFARPATRVLVGGELAPDGLQTCHEGYSNARGNRIRYRPSPARPEVFLQLLAPPGQMLRAISCGWSQESDLAATYQSYDARQEMSLLVAVFRSGIPQWTTEIAGVRGYPLVGGWLSDSSGVVVEVLLGQGEEQHFLVTRDNVSALNIDGRVIDILPE